MIKVSILIPIYNVEKYLRQCLDSVVNQTLKEIEIICINDGSTDRSLEIINEYANQDDRIKVIDKKNSGYGHSMNCGLEIAQGEYIGIVESDDYAELKMFEVLYNKAKSFNAEIVESNHYRYINGHSFFIEALNGETYEKIFSPRRENHKFFNHQIAIWSAIYRRDLLLKNDIHFTETPGASYQDVSFSFKAFTCAEKLFLLKDAFIHYRMDNPNASMQSKEKVYAIFNEFDEIDKFLLEHKEFQNPMRYIFEASIKFQRAEFHYNRIDERFKLEFFDRLIKEFQRDEVAGYLDKNFWKIDKWNLLQEMIHSDFEKVFYKYYEKAQKFQLAAKGFLESLKTFDNIYIYGAGYKSAYTLTRAFQWKFSIKGFLVTSLKNNPQMIAKIPVKTLKESNVDKNHDAILISIKDENQYEIFYKLKSEGYRNVILMTRDLHVALR